jgi:hypothetical protein
MGRGEVGGGFQLGNLASDVIRLGGFVGKTFNRNRIALSRFSK